jgi:ferredoxin
VPRLTIDGRTIDVEPGTTVLAAAHRLGISIPTLCHLEGIEPLATCMVCLVEERRSGRLVPSCSARAEEGMAIDTNGGLVQQARRTALELLLSEHAGECEAPCQRACPLGIDIPEMLDRLECNGEAAAWRVLREAVPMPATAARLCPGGCEKACRRRSLDAPVRVAEIHRELADWGLRQGPGLLPPCAAATGKRVTIVGAGLVGLAAADRLLTLGHACTLYERGQAVAESFRRTAVLAPQDAQALSVEIDAILSRGATVHLGVAAGGGVPWHELRSQCDVLLLATTEAPCGVDAPGLETRDGVVAVGKTTRPGRNALRALVQGREMGQAVHRLLVGDEAPLTTGRGAARLGPMTSEDLRTLAGNRLRRNGGPAVVEADPDGCNGSRIEARRCLGCGCRSAPSCTLRRLCQEHGVEPRRYAGRRRPIEPVEEHALVRYEPGKCILCGRCARLAEAADEPLGLAVTGRGPATRISVPLGRPLAQSLERSAVACAKACPTGALSLRSDTQKGQS